MPPEISRRQENAMPRLDARPGDLPSRLAARLRGQHPAAVFAVVALIGYVLLAGLTIALGLVLVDTLLPAHGLSAEEGINTWLTAHRSPWLNQASAVGSAIGDVPAVPVLVAAAALWLFYLRRFRAVAFLVGAILLEVATYRAASLLVHRERPQVAHLDALPLDQSFPSGHVAASVVVYGGLALLITSLYRERWVLWVCWSLAFALPAVVGLSRMYRGMHHLTDVGAGALVGIGSLIVALIATRSCGEAVRYRRRARAPASRVGART